MRPGMLVAFCTLAAGCVVFGVLPHLVLAKIVAPAAQILVEPHAYATAVLGGTVRIDAEHPHFEYFAATEILVTAGCLVAGIALAWWYIRRPEPKVITALRSVHTGSVNDYTAFSVAGLVLVSATLLLSQS
jgi:multicomponent Na+:H+ antiporter subunit D